MKESFFAIVILYYFIKLVATIALRLDERFKQAIRTLPYSRYEAVFIRSLVNGCIHIQGVFRRHLYTINTISGFGPSLIRITVSPRPIYHVSPRQKPAFTLEDMKTLFSAAEEPFVKYGQINASSRGCKLFYEYAGTRYDDQLLAWLSDLADNYRAIVALAGQAMPHLLEIKDKHNHPLQPLAIQLLKDIAHKTENHLGAYQIETLLCPHCLVRFRVYKIQLSPLEQISIYGCRACCQSKDFLELKNRKLVAVLDSNMTDSSQWADDVVRVNALQRQSACDFDGIEIWQATDEEVERFVVNYSNATGAVTAAPDKPIPCAVVSECRLSENTRRILQKTFGSVDMMLLAGRLA